jgi:hypothetical protein
MDFPSSVLRTIAILFPLSLPTAVSADQVPSPIILGVLENVPGVYSLWDVRVVFEKIRSGWKSFPNDALSEEDLKEAIKNYPREMSWAIVFRGKKLAELESRAPRDFTHYASIGQENIAGYPKIPTVGKRTSKFAEDPSEPVYRPLVAVSKPYYADPEHWESYTPSHDELDDASAHLLMAVRDRDDVYPGWCDDKKPRYGFTANDAAIAAGYKNKLGDELLAIRAKTSAGLCDRTGDSYAGLFWFYRGGKESIRLIGAGLRLVDFGDYDHDGKSEELFMIDGQNRGGYSLFWDQFKKSSSFAFSFH